MPSTIISISFKKDDETEITGLFHSTGVIVNIDSISVSLSREMAPVSIMGNPTPTSLSGGSRRIQGTMYVPFSEIQDPLELVQPINEINIKKNGETIYTIEESYLIEVKTVISTLQYQILFTSQKLQAIIKETGRSIFVSEDEIINGMLGE